MTDTERVAVIGDLQAALVRQRGEIAALTARAEAAMRERDEAVELLRLGKLAIVTQLDTLIQERDDARAALRELVEACYSAYEGERWHVEIEAFRRAKAKLGEWESARALLDGAP